jgi:hypothetical protein
MPRKGEPKNKPPVTTPEIAEDVALWDKFKGSGVMQAALGEHGLTPELAAKALLSELSATVVKTQIVEGRWVASKPQVAWDIRQKARQDLTRYWGAYKQDDAGDDGPLVVEIRDCTAPIRTPVSEPESEPEPEPENQDPDA